MFQTFKLKIPVFTLEMTILNTFTLSKLKHIRSEIGPRSTLCIKHLNLKY